MCTCVLTVIPHSDASDSRIVIESLTTTKCGRNCSSLSRPTIKLLHQALDRLYAQPIPKKSGRDFVFTLLYKPYYLLFRCNYKYVFCVRVQLTRLYVKNSLSNNIYNSYLLCCSPVVFNEHIITDSSRIYMYTPVHASVQIY